MTTADMLATVRDSGPLRRLGGLVRENFVYAALVALVVVFTATSPYFLTGQNIANIGRQTAAVSIVAVGMALVIITGNIDLSIGSLFALCGMAAALAMQRVGNQWWLGAIAAIAVGVVFGLMNGLATVRLGVPSFLVTLGSLGVARGIALLITDTRPVLIANPTYFAIFGETKLFGVIPISVVWTLIIVGLGALVLHKSVFGLRVFATGGNPRAARYTGVKTDRTILQAFVITGGLTAVAALLFTGVAHAARPDLGVGFELDVIAAVILGGVSLFGGRGTILGVFVGSLLIGVINNGLVLLGVNSSVQQIIKGLIIVAAVALTKKS